MYYSLTLKVGSGLELLVSNFQNPNVTIYLSLSLSLPPSGFELFIPHMDLHESAVGIARRQALTLLRRNVVGPKKYVEITYSPYRSLMDGNASLEVDNFLKHSEENELPAFAKV
jgi:hypothetical protein